MPCIDATASTRPLRLLLFTTATALTASSTVAGVSGFHASMSAWAEQEGDAHDAPTVVVTTNAPVLRWKTLIDSGGTFAYSVEVYADGVPVHGTPLQQEQKQQAPQATQVVWTSGQVWQGNWYGTLTL